MVIIASIHINEHTTLNIAQMVKHLKVTQDVVWSMVMWAAGNAVQHIQRN